MWNNRLPLSVRYEIDQLLERKKMADKCTDNSHKKIIVIDQYLKHLFGCTRKKIIRTYNL